MTIKTNAQRTLASGNHDAQEAFTARVVLIREHLEELRMAADDHFDCQPEQVNWGDMGFITDVEKALREIADRVFKRGEYAVTR